MERVHFYQEQMLPELKELEIKGIFSKSETRAILKQRTIFESALIRRVALKSDFVKYVQYEITLESLRRKRVARLNVKESKTSLSDYCIVRRQFFILERAVRKFKNDVSFWIQYIELAKFNNARSLVGKLCSRALSLHPTSSPLYIIAASHELDSSLSPAGARALLQRGLRINPESVELWTEYVRMELGYCEGLRRRWKVLGIDDGAQAQDGDAREAILSGAIVRAVISSATQALPTLALLGSLQALLQSYPTELRESVIDHLHSEFAARDTGPGAAGEDFRSGAMFLRATVGIPARSLVSGAQLPRLPALRPLVAAAFPTEATPFPQEEQTGGFARKMRNINEALSSIAKANLRVAELYARWVAAWVSVINENNLRLYLVLSLNALATHLCKLEHNASSITTLSIVLRIALHLNNAISSDEAQSRKLSRKFSRACPTDIGLWLARLDAESGAARPMDAELSTYSPPSNMPEPISKLWAEALEKAKEQGDEQDLLVELWTWGINHLPRDSGSQARADTWTIILRQSLTQLSPSLHSNLLVCRLYDEEQSPSGRASLAKKLIAKYRPSILFFSSAMRREVQILQSSKSGLEVVTDSQPLTKKRKRTEENKSLVDSNTPPNYQCLEVLYTAWRIIPNQAVPAVIEWAKSLHQLGERERAEDAIRAAGGSKGQLQQEWEKIRNGGCSEESNNESTGSSKNEQDIKIDDVEYS